MSQPERVSDILPRVLSHLWGAQRNEYGSWVKRCPCGVIEREVDGKTEFWRWEGRELRRYALSPPHPEQAA
jgi:hypothetical protein